MNKLLNLNILLVAIFLFRVFLSFIVWHPDLNNHIDWGIRFYEYGPKMFYSSEANVWSYTWPNQPPGTIYMFAGIRKLFEFVFNLVWQVNIHIPAFPSIIVSYFETNLYPALLKLPAILSDFGIAYLIYKIVFEHAKSNARKKAILASIIWLINPIIWYNSSVWGQYDAVINFFALLSFYMLTKNKLTLSILFFALSIYTKASLLIFMPIWIIYALSQKYNIYSWLKGIFVSLFVILFLTIPFADKNTLVWLYELYTEKIFVQQLHVITANAFNLWAGIAGIHERPDSLPFLGFTYSFWGYLLFIVSYIYLVYKFIKLGLKRHLYFTLAMVAFSSFVLLTNMHERYLYPLFPYLTIILSLSFVKKSYYWLVSTISLLNLYNFWFVPKVGLVISFLSFGERLTPRILGFMMFGLYLILFRIYNESK